MKALILSIIASSPPQDYLLPNTFLEGQCLHFLICITALDIRMTLSSYQKHVEHFLDLAVVTDLIN